MNKLLVTAALSATVFSSMVALSPGRAAATPSIPIPPPQLIAPDLRNLQPVPPVLLSPFRAELSAHIVTRPTGYPGWTWVICIVRNTGPRNSGPFQTLLTKIYVGTPALPGPAVAVPVPMNIPAGGQHVIIFAENAPLRVGLSADITHAVPEYSEVNNEASLDIMP